MTRFSLLLVVLCTITVLSCGKPTLPISSKVLNYLERYGYLSPADVEIGKTKLNSGKVSDAVRKLQHFAGLNETGNPLDSSTVELVTKQRCGFRDLGNTAQFKRRRRYALHGTWWRKHDLKYKMVKYTADLSVKDVDKTIKGAMDLWAKVTPLTFTKVTSGPADIDIFFDKAGDKGYSFDGRGGELAFAYFPGNNAGLFGDVHFDDEEQFTTNNKGGGVDLFWLALHELGHSLGLDHSSNKDAIMYPIYRGSRPGLQLHRDDIMGIQQLYRESTIAKVTTTPQVHTTRQSIPGKPDPCDSTLDAMVMTADKTTYAFKGAYFWPVGDYGVFTEALKISEFWEGLEGDIDAAYTRQYDGLTFIFKGSKYWTYKNMNLVKGASNVSDLNLPNAVHNMDAAVERGADGHLYIFKGDKFWRYDGYKKSVDPGYPKLIRSVLPGLQRNIHAALQWKNGKTFFFKGERYYVLDDSSWRIRQGFPKSISTYWMGCSPEGLTSGRILPHGSVRKKKQQITAKNNGVQKIKGGFVMITILYLLSQYF